MNNPGEDTLDRAFRPLTFADFCGQKTACENFQIYINSAKKRGESLDHILLSGPPGLGKTTMANILANEMGSKTIILNAPTIKSKGELAGIFLKLEKNDILFLDEIHRLHPAVEELMYSALEDFRLEVVTGVGAAASALSIDLPPFTLIGATTRQGMLTKPLLDRFGDVVEFELYSIEELASIVSRSAKKLGLECVDGGDLALAARSRGTPRIANRLLRRIRDFAQSEDKTLVDPELVNMVCNRLGVDSRGLDKTCRRMLVLLANKNRPMGMDAIAAALGESRDTIEDVCEPFLLNCGFIERSHQGRTATPLAREHLNAA